MKRELKGLPERLGAKDLEQLAREVDGQRTDGWVLDARRLDARLGLWDMGQLMRQDILNMYQRGKLHGNRELSIENFMDEQGFADPGRYPKMSALQSYALRAHETFNPNTGRFGIHPYHDLVDLWMEAYEWVKKRFADKDWQVATCGQGRRRRFVSDSVFGLECALHQLGWTIRYETRAMRPEILARDHVYEPLTDHLEAFIREIVAGLFCFAVTDREGNVKARPALWNEASWRRVFNAFLQNRHVDSFVEWLQLLPRWDGEPRLDTWLADAGLVFDREIDPELLRWCSRTIPQLAIARAEKPVKHDTVPVLIGPQGTGKSTAIAQLFADTERLRWFTDSLALSARGKERVESLQGKVLVEISEMTGSTAADIESIKQFLSSEQDRVRLAYRRNSEDMPRAVSIVGTANGNAVLPNDPTGNRRFVALPVTDGDPARIRRHLDQHRLQIWAEALFRHREGELTWFPRELELRQRQANEQFRSADNILEDGIARWLLELHRQQQRHFTLHHLVEELKLAGENTPETLSMQDQKRIGRVLTRFGLAKQRLATAGQRQYVWVLPDNLPEVLDSLQPARNHRT